MQRLILIGAILSFVAPTSTVAQTYSDVEREVWAAIEDCWDAWDGQEDLERWSRDCWHDQATFFLSTEAAPFRKDWPRRAGPLWFARHDHERSAYDLRPLAITVFDEVAVVHYFARVVSMEDGEVQNVAQKRTETLLRTNGRWLVIGVHVSPSP